jgi:oxygen-dependent protoporphyrinogen oxidase
VSGLAAAYALGRLPQAPTITLLEASSHLGGKIDTNVVGGRLVDAGPDALLIRDPAVKALLDELGLTAQVKAPTARGSFVWTRGALRALPPSTLFGVPLRMRDLMKSGIVSWPGLLRATGDFVLPRLRHGVDPTVGKLLRPRLGREVFDKLVDPMLGGIYAGRANLLSAQSAVPEVAAVLAPARSIYLTMRERATKQPSVPAGPALVSFPGGMAAVVDALAARTAADVHCNAAVVSIKRGKRRWKVITGDGREFKADDVVLATPAYATASLLRDVDAAAADALQRIPYASVANVTFVYPRSAIDKSLQGTGFLVPAVDERFIVGCTWMDQKWGRDVLVASGADEAIGDDAVIIRASVGRHGDDRWVTMTDEEIAVRAHAELVLSMGLRGKPLTSTVKRWPLAMPQYTAGHANRLAAIDARLAQHSGLHLVGAGYRGIGVASCLITSQAVAATIGANA